MNVLGISLFGRISRDVQPKGCDVTMLNYVRRRHGTLASVLVDVFAMVFAH